jgi:hypothetical protein
LWKSRPKVEFEREIEILKGSIEEVKQALRSIPVLKLKYEVFFTTAITESDIMDVIFMTEGAPEGAACGVALKMLK